MPPKVIFMRIPLKLDALFGYTLMNVTGEPVTPTKIATFYLIRTLFHAHFGVRAVPSLKPFNRHEKTRIFTIIYGLIMLESEISYDDFRRLARMLNDELGRGIYYRFVTSMEKMANGDESIEMLFENAFYTARRENSSKIRKRTVPSLDSLTFMNKSSFVYIWMKRVMLQYTRTPQIGMFAFCEMMKEWVHSGNVQLVSPSHFGLDTILPYDIDCSVRARNWLAAQLRLVQFCPSQAMPYKDIIDWCDIIAKYHLDVVNVHLLKAVVHVQLKNPPAAVESLKKFFDLSMLQINEHTGKCLKTLVLMEPCQVALKYGPVLQGRVHRIFGDNQYADSLFAESIQQAQLNNEILCNRIANLELTISSMLQSGPILEKAYTEEDPNDQDRRVVQQTIHMGAEVDRPAQRAIKRDDDFQENFEMHTFLCSISKLLVALNNMMEGRYFTYNRTPSYVAMGIHRLWLFSDPRNKGRIIDDYANAILASGLVQNGMYSQAKRVAETMLVNNVEAPCTVRMETESYAVAGVNLVYSQAATGDYSTAFETLRILESLYPDDLNWQSARHVRICSQIVHFERDFLLNRYTACSKHLAGLQTAAPLEYALRKALLLATTGKLAEAVDVLKALKCDDVRGKIRIHMQLATILTGYQRFESAEFHIEEAGKIGMNVSFRDVDFLISRRVGSMMLARFMPEKAFLVLVELRTRVEHFASFIEKAVYYMAVARCLRLLGKDPRPFLKKSKLQIRGNRWPAMEKLILTELAIIHSPNGLFPDELKASRVKEQFGIIEMDHPGPCSWMFI